MVHWEILSPVQKNDVWSLSWQGISGKKNRTRKSAARSSLFELVAASLRWYYPVQVLRVVSEVDSQPFGSPSIV
jgi:hypothetical protein